MKQNSQTATILAHLKRKSSISAVDAWDAYKVRSLPRRIKDLRAMGYNISSEPKVHDITKQRYVRYHLLSNVPGPKPIAKPKKAEQPVSPDGVIALELEGGKVIHLKLTTAAMFGKVEVQVVDVTGRRLTCGSVASFTSDGRLVVPSHVGENFGLALDAMRRIRVGKV